MSLSIIGAKEFCDQFTKAPEDWEVIDIREPYEYAIIRIKEAKLVPMSALEFRLEEIDWSKRVLFYCRTGSRSRFLSHRVAERKDVIDLEGGIFALYSLGCDFLEWEEGKLGGYFS